jgi:polysaccharide export outer membrane protein
MKTGQLKTVGLRWLLVTGICLAILPACDEVSFEKDEPEVDPVSLYPQEFLRENVPDEEFETVVRVGRDYRLRPSDQIEIIYNVETLKDPRDYTLKIRDVLDVRFPFCKRLDQEGLEVQSDGTIQLNLLGSVSVVDKKIQEVQKELVEKYSRLIKNPEVTLTFKESKRDIMDLREAITTSPRGMSRLLPVTPDGTVAVPLIGTVNVGGRTIDEVHEDINQKYDEIGLPDIEVTVNVQTVTPMRVYVLGEVKKPGLVMSHTGTNSHVARMTLLQAMAGAGSYAPKRAELSKVLLMRHRDVPHPQVAVVNLHQLLENQVKTVDMPYLPDSSEFRRDIWLKDGDVIFIPTKKIARRADYIEYVWTRGIYGVLPFSVSAQYTAGDAVDWLGPNP